LLTITVEISHVLQIRNVRTAGSIFSLHIMQSSMLMAHSSQATKWRQSGNNVRTWVRLHFRQVTYKRNRSFSFINYTLSTNRFAIQLISTLMSQHQMTNLLIYITFLFKNTRWLTVCGWRSSFQIKTTSMQASL